MKRKNLFLSCIIISLLVLSFLFAVKAEELLSGNGEENNNEVISETKNYENVNVMPVNSEEKIESEIITSKNNENDAADKDSKKEYNLESAIYDIDSNKSLEIVVINKPSGSLNKSFANFSFFINTSNINSTNCSFNLNLSSTTVYSTSFSDSNKDINVSGLANGAYNWQIYCVDSYNYSIYEDETASFSVNIDYTTINFWPSKNSSSTGEYVHLYVVASLPYPTPINVVINYSDGRSPSGQSINAPTSSYSNTFSPLFNVSGNYTMGLTFTANGTNYYRSLIVRVNGTNTQNNNNQNTNGNDGEKPEVTLYSPDDDESIESESIEFLFRARDNVKVSNCTFSLYYYNNSGSIGSLVYEEVKTNPSSSSNMSIELEDFDEGDYLWEVECIDNSSNRKSSDREFYYGGGSTITTNTVSNIERNEESSYQYLVDDIDDVIETINNFLVNEERYGLDEKEAVLEMNYLERSRQYKKRLLQIRTDLLDDLGYSRDLSAKEKRVEEIKTEINEIKGEAITELSVEGSERYSKSSIDSDIKEVVKSYLDKYNIFMSERDIKNLAEEVLKKQQDMSVDSKVMWVTLDYVSGASKDYTLIKKDVKFKNEFEGVIEVIPKSVSESASDIEYFVNSDIIKEDPIIYFDYEDLKKSSLIYMVPGKADFNDVKEGDSIGFSLDFEKSKSNLITGYAVLIFPQDKGFWFYFSWILFLIVLATIIYNIIIAKRKSKIRKDAYAREIHANILKAKEAIEDKNIVKAKELYSLIKELYSKSNEEVKAHFYKKLSKLSAIIDRKDISELIKECVLAINQNRKEDAIMLYGKIKPIYKRLPEELREKVYTKIMPYMKS